MICIWSFQCLTTFHNPYFMSFFNRLLMKFLASSEISSKASSSKSQVADVTLDKVSLSLSPIKGESPLTLKINKIQIRQLLIRLLKPHKIKMSIRSILGPQKVNNTVLETISINIAGHLTWFILHHCLVGISSHLQTHVMNLLLC